MEKFNVLARDFGRLNQQFSFEEIEAENKAEAWEIVELNILNSNTQAWLLNSEEKEELIKLLEEAKK